MKIPYKQNMGILDRMFRVGIGTILVVLGIMLIMTTIGIILMILSLPLLISGVTGFCPAYVLFGISTKHVSRCC